MSTQLTIEGRLVQGGVVLKPSKDMKTQQPKKDDQGKVIEECFMAIAVPKKVRDAMGNVIDNPKIGEYYAAFDAQARASFPHLFPNGGVCSHPRFAMKWQDGDGVDSNGKSVAGNEGFPGHWIIKCNTRYAPTCVTRTANGYMPMTDPEKSIKRGYFVAVAITIDGNGVEPNNAQAVPGLFVSPNMVLLTAQGPEITSGPDPTQAFAGVQTDNSLPAPTNAAPGPTPGLAAPPMPGSAPTPTVAAPTPAAALPTPGPVAAPANLPMPGAPRPAANLPVPGGAPVPAQPQYAPTASAQGATVDQLLNMGVGWTIESLLAAGHIVRVA
jgi:hypothetical protein